MKKRIKLFLDRKFPFDIEVVSKQHDKFPGLLMQIYKSGDKRLFVRMLGDQTFAYHFFDVNPKQLMDWFKISHSQAETAIIDWAESKRKKVEI